MPIPTELEHCLHPVGGVLPCGDAIRVPISILGSIVGYSDHEVRARANPNDMCQRHRCCFCGNSAFLVGESVPHGPHHPLVAYVFKLPPGIRCPARPY